MNYNKPIIIDDNICYTEGDSDNSGDYDPCKNRWVWAPHFLKVGAIRSVVANGKCGFHACMEGLKRLDLDDVDKNICNSIVCFQNEIFRFGIECRDEYESSGNGLFAADGVDNEQVHRNLFKRLESLKSKYKPNQHAKKDQWFGDDLFFIVSRRFKVNIFVYTLHSQPMKTRSMKKRRKTSEATMDVETEFYWYQNSGVILRSRPKQKNHSSHVVYPTRNALCILYSQNHYSYIVAGDEYPKSPLPGITFEAEVNEAACVLTSFTYESDKRGVGSVRDATAVVDVGAKAVAAISGARNDDNLSLLASASCHLQNTPQKEPAKDQICYYHPICQKMASICGGWHMGKCCDYGPRGPLHHLLPENFLELRKQERKRLQTESLKKSRMRAKDHTLKKKGIERRVVYPPHPTYHQYSLYPPELLPPMPYYPWGTYPQQHLHTLGANFSMAYSNGLVIERLSQENAQLKDEISKINSLVSKNK